jgi:acyl carrier protein
MEQMRPDPDPSLIARLCALLSDVTGAPLSGLGPHSTPENTPGWDSVANLNFITGAEEEFDVVIPTAVALSIRSVADMARFLTESTTRSG